MPREAPWIWGSQDRAQGRALDQRKLQAIPREVPWISASSRAFPRARPESREAPSCSAGSAQDLGKLAGVHRKRPGSREALGHAIPRGAPWISGSSRPLTGKRPGSREAQCHSQGSALDLGKLEAVPTFPPRGREGDGERKSQSGRGPGLPREKGVVDFATRKGGGEEKADVGWKPQPGGRKP